MMNHTVNHTPPSEQQPGSGEYYYEPEIHLRDYFHILWIRRWWVLTGFVVVVLTALYYVLTTQPVYESEVALYYERENPQNFLIETLTTAAPQALEVEAQKEFLTSPAVLGEVVKQLRVEPVVKFTPDELEFEALEEALNITSPRGSNLLKLTARADSPKKAQLLAALASRAFLEQKRKRKTSDLEQALAYLKNQIITLEKEIANTEQELNRFRTQEGIYTTTDRQATLAGVVSYSLLDQLAALQREQTNAEMELALAKSQLETLKKQAEELRSQLDPKTMMSALSSTGLPPQIEQYQKKVIDLQIQLDTALDTYTPESLEVQQLQQQLEAAQKRLDAEVEAFMRSSHGAIDPVSELRSVTAQVISQSARVESLKRKAEFYKAKVEEFQKQHPELVNKEVKLMALERRKRQYEETYGFLVQRQKETELLMQMETSDFEIYKPATLPEYPVKPRKAMTLALAVIVGLMLGMGSAFFLEYMDDSIKTKEQVERVLGLPVVGTIPKIVLGKKEREAVQSKVNLILQRANKNKINVPETEGGLSLPQGTSPPAHRSRHSKGYRKRVEELVARTLLNLERKSQAAESYRILRANVQFANVDNPPKMLLISSSTPGEGKTLTACNLALSLAETGMNVLLADCDLRRPKTHIPFALERTPGLTDYLVQRDMEGIPAWLEKEVDVPNLRVVTGGSHSPNPAELLGSQKMRALLKAWREAYDIVILDVPPVLSVADASVLAREVDSILLVIRAHRTKERAAEQARETLMQTNTPIFGVVLNDVDYSKQYGAYYYYYHYYYKSYYNSEDEEM